jgi:hypothetical protein
VTTPKLAPLTVLKRGQVMRYGIVEANLALIDERHDRRSGEGLARRGDHENTVASHPAAAFQIRVARSFFEDDLPALLDKNHGARNSGDGVSPFASSFWSTKRSMSLRIQDDFSTAGGSPLFTGWNAHHFSLPGCDAVSGFRPRIQAAI